MPPLQPTNITFNTSDPNFWENVSSTSSNPFWIHSDPGGQAVITANPSDLSSVLEEMAASAKGLKNMTTGSNYNLKWPSLPKNSIANEWKLTSPFCVLLTTPDFKCGIEYEVEAVINVDYGKLAPHGIDTTEDLSLKYYGKEFLVTPRTVSEHLTAYHHLLKAITFVNGADRLVDPWNERTSTHVHVNCLGLTVPQIRAGLLLYAILEPYFFGMVAPHRRHNIHCVALQDTLLFNQFKWKDNQFGVNISQWSKYTAFNLLPLKKLGTIEFRHMQGAGNSIHLMHWLRLIEAWYNLIQSETVTDAHIKTALRHIKEPKAIVKSLFPNMLDFYNGPLITNEDLTPNILNLKISMLNSEG
jgi:hypothetical protein